MILLQGLHVRGMNASHVDRSRMVQRVMTGDVDRINAQLRGCPASPFELVANLVDRGKVATKWMG